MKGVLCLMPHHLIQYVKSLLELQGSVVENDGETLQAVLSQDAAHTLNQADAKLNCKDGAYRVFHFTQSEQARSEGSVYITYGSPILKRISELMNNKGLATAYAYEGLYLKKAHLDDQFHKTFQWVKMKPIWEGAHERLHSYLLIYYKYKALSDDRIEGLIRVALSEQTGAVPEQFIERNEQCSFKAVPFSRRHENMCSPCLPLPVILEHAQIYAKHTVLLELEPFIKRMQDRKERDSKRVHHYYATLKTQIGAYIEKRNLDGDARVKQEEKLRAVERDLARAGSDIEDKYLIDVELAPVAAVRMFVPVLVNSAAVLRGKNRGKKEMVWNSVTKEYDPIVCAFCKRSTYSFGSCERWHWLCILCYNIVCVDCGKKRCPVCAPLCERC